jgi:hypothetical protein
MLPLLEALQNVCLWLKETFEHSVVLKQFTMLCADVHSSYRQTPWVVFITTHKKNPYLNKCLLWNISSEGHRYITGLTRKWMGGCIDRQKKIHNFSCTYRVKNETWSTALTVPLTEVWLLSLKADHNVL